jgi:DNA repair protein RadC
MIVASARTAADLLAPLFDGSAVEKVATLHLGAAQELIAIVEEESAGGEGEVDLPLRSILSEALRLDSRSVVVAHNHPSGHAVPSAKDREATRLLAQVTAPLGIRLQDHLIFAAGDCCSFRALGLL